MTRKKAWALNNAHHLNITENVLRAFIIFSVYLNKLEIHFKSSILGKIYCPALVIIWLPLSDFLVLFLLTYKFCLNNAWNINRLQLICNNWIYYLDSRRRSVVTNWYSSCGSRAWVVRNVVCFNCGHYCTYRQEQ